jgi:hypothetical protein
MKPISGLQEFLDEQCLSRKDFEEMTGESADNYEGLSYWQIFQEVLCDEALSHEMMRGGI